MRLAWLFFLSSSFGFTWSFSVYFQCAILHTSVVVIKTHCQGHCQAGLMASWGCLDLVPWTVMWAWLSLAWYQAGSACNRDKLAHLMFSQSCYLSLRKLTLETECDKESVSKRNPLLQVLMLISSAKLAFRSLAPLKLSYQVCSFIHAELVFRSLSPLKLSNLACSLIHSLVWYLWIELFIKLFQCSFTIVFAYFFMSLLFLIVYLFSSLHFHGPLCWG